MDNGMGVVPIELQNVPTGLWRIVVLFHGELHVYVETRSPHCCFMLFIGARKLTDEVYIVCERTLDWTWILSDTERSLG